MSDFTLSLRELFLSRNTVVEMLKDRGYQTNQTVYTDFDEFYSLHSTCLSNIKSMNFVATRSGESSSVIAVNFTTEEKLLKKNVEHLLMDYTTQSINRVILITVNKLNHAIISYIKSLKNIIIETFEYKELLFNPTKHQLVPKQRILTGEETKNLLESLNCQIDELPVMLKKDVIARYLGTELNDVIEIIRESKTAGKSIYYRAIKE
ncbi:hypothetical protein NUSPORA_02073 [Nucleospora cyclopteri]